MPKVKTKSPSIQLSNQEIFDKVWKEQGNPSLDSNKDICLYYGDNGAKCDIGKIIPRKLYSKDFEDKSPSQLIEEYNLFPAAQAKFLDDLQRAHDRAIVYSKVDLSDFKEVHKRYLEAFAKEYKLTIPISKPAKKVTSKKTRKKKTKKKTLS